MDRCHCSKSARANRYTLAEVFCPPRLTTWSRALVATEAVYCLQLLLPGTVVALDRHYKPVSEGIERPCFVAYDAYPEHRFSTSDLDLGACASSRPGVGWWLWKGRPPWTENGELAAYRQTLHAVFGGNGLTRLAAIAGRDLGDLSLWEALS